jgi:hypothetical protein
VAERRPHTAAKAAAGDAGRVVRLARPSARMLPPAANDNAPRYAQTRRLVPLVLAAGAALLLLARVAG